MLAEEVQHCVFLQLVCWVDTYFVMYSTMWPFRLPLCIWVVDSSCSLCNSPQGALYVGEGSAAIWPSIMYNSRWMHTCFVMYCTNACACNLSVHHFALGVGGSSFNLHNSPKGALYVGEGSAARQHCILYNSRWVYGVLHHCDLSVAPLWPFRCTIVTFPFTTLRSGRILVMRFVQLARGSSLRRWRKHSDSTFHSQYLMWDRHTHTNTVRVSESTVVLSM